VAVPALTGSGHRGIRQEAYDKMINSNSEDSEPHFFDALRQQVCVGDICLVIGLAEKDDEKYDALVPILIVEILKMRTDTLFEYRVLISAADTACNHYQRFIMKNDAATSDQFVRVNNPEFFSDSEQMAKILVMQYDFKNDHER